MDIQLKGVRKKSRVLWEVISSDQILLFWRTSRYSITRDIIKKAGLNVDKYGAVTYQLTFRIRKKT